MQANAYLTAGGARTAERTRSRVRSSRPTRLTAGKGPAPRHLAALLEQRAFVVHRCATDLDGVAIDHVAVAPSGVWIVADRRVRLERVRLRWGLRGAPALRFGATDRTDLLELLDCQRKLVTQALADQPGVPIHTALSVTGGQFPLLGSLASGGHVILPPTELAARVGSSGPLRRSDSRAIAQLLDERLGS